MILGLIDIEANYLVIKAYQYTTLTSVQVGYTPASVCCSLWGKEKKDCETANVLRSENAEAWGLCYVCPIGH